MAAHTLLSLLIFIHLFGVVVALVSYTSASPLEQRLLEVLPYLKTLDFDLIHNYPSLARLHLTHSRPTDIDYSVRIDAVMPDNSTQTFLIPPPDAWPGIRQRRYQALANVMGSLAGGDDAEAILPRAVAGSILRQAGSKRGTIWITAHDLPSMDDLTVGKSDRRDPNSSVYRSGVYEATVLVGKDSVNVMKKSATGEVAPVEPAGGKPKDKAAPGREGKSGNAKSPGDMSAGSAARPLIPAFPSSEVTP